MSAQEQPGGRGLSHSLLLLMATATGLCVGGNYLNQPLLDEISRHFGVPVATAATSVTVAQFAYALGLVLFVPLGDMVNRRKLAVTLLVLSAAGLLTAAVSTTFTVMMIGTAVGSLFSVAAQVLVPFASELAAPGRGGSAVGTMMTGLLVGILVARAVSGMLSMVGGWKTAYWVLGVLLVAMAAALWRALPDVPVPETFSLTRVPASMAKAWTRYPKVRSRAVISALLFASMSACFATMTPLLAGPPHDLGPGVIGLLGLLGVVGAFAAGPVGRLADRGLGNRAVASGLAILAAGWLAMWFGTWSVVMFGIGFILVDLGLQSAHVTNMNVVYAQEPTLRSRLNSLYMTTYFIGGSVGSAVAVGLWSRFGWHGVVIAALAFVAAAGVVFALELLRDRRSTV
ncbi:MFS transporter [Acidipropionibacterium virtanenii]|uniref:MFS transporter n=1 Tax=Acidipropionibacterium virtanenii TaxID=2057246 RepID=UPI0015F0CD3D|nr:MFS transporter [Acidipropionibacterium virtanenii]